MPASRQSNDFSSVESGLFADDAAPLPPPEIPDHILIRRIGRGGYGQVWLARSALGALRAVKVVYRRSFEDDRPYEREFEGIEKFEPISRSHEGLIDILQVGRNDSAQYFYYVMELADDAKSDRSDGASYSPKTLKSEIRARGRLPAEECVRLGLSLADALRHLHEHGLIHRDIKPSNIIFVRGVPKLADIGLVAEAGRTISCVGTEGFIPLEGPGTPQADLYSLGKALYEISAGKDRTSYPEPPTRLAELPDRDQLLELNEVIFKACAPDARNRYQTAKAMHGDLALVQSGGSVKRMRLVERRLALAMRAFAVVISLTLLAGAAYYQARRAEKTATQRLIRLNVLNAVRLMDEGDTSGALPWIAESLRLAENDPVVEEMQRYRFAAAARHCPQLTALSLHENRIHDAAFSPDGARFVTASADRTARVWDASTGEELTPPLAHENEVTHVACSPDGRRIVTVSQDATIRIWNAATGQPVCPPAHSKLHIRSLRFSPNGQRILTGCGVFESHLDRGGEQIRPTTRDAIAARADGQNTGEAQVWDASTGRPILPPLAHSAPVFDASFSSDGTKIVTASEDQTAIVWDAATGQPLIAPLRHQARIRRALFSPNNQFVLTASEDNTAQLWDANTGQPAVPPLRHANGLLHAAFSPDGTRIVTTSRDQTACLWETSSGRLIGLPLRHNHEVRHAVFSPNNKWLATAGSEQIVRIWNVATGELLAQLAHNNSGTFATFSPDGERLLTVSRDHLARVWDLSALRQPAIDLPHESAVLSAEFSPDGSRVLTGTVGQAVRFWDSATGKLAAESAPSSLAWFFNATFSPDGNYALRLGTIATYFDARTGALAGQLPAITRPWRCGSFSPDSQRIVTGGYRTAIIWSIATGQPASPPMEHQSEVWSAAFSPDGRWIVTGSGHLDDPEKGSFQVWDARTGKPFSPPIPLRGVVRHVRFSPNGRRVLTACTMPASEEREAQLWDWRTGRQVIPPMRHSDGVPYAEFSPDGNRILTASLDKTARIWDAATGLPLTPALKHNRQVKHAAFSPDGRRVVTASEDGTARVWDALTGEPLTTLLKHKSQISRAQFSPNGDRIVTAGHDNAARIWNVSKSDRPVPDLILMAGLLSGQEIDPAGNLTLIPSKELLNRWRSLRAKYPID